MKEPEFDLIVATRNRHKVTEISSILGKSFRYRGLDAFHTPPKVVEDADSFEGNAVKKAGEVARWLKTQPASAGIASRNPTFVLADDSGLEVDALNGAPGIHSARFAALDSGCEDNSSDAENNAKLLRLLAEVPPPRRTARFRCVLALMEILPQSSEARPRIFDGVCEGQIAFSPSGGDGFGYDPLFIPVGFEKSFAELGEEIKNRISHRANALEKLKAALARF